jgi:hypothetical protein
MGEFFNRWLFSISWRAQFVQFALFVAFFSLYDATVLYLGRGAPHGVSLVNYVVRDQRTDESTMYMSAVRELVDKHYESTDPYLKEHRKDPSIRPELPVWIGYLCYKVGGSANVAVFLLHTIFPALGAILLVRLFAGFVTPRIALALVILSIGGACYAINNYFEWLHLAKLSGPYTYTPEEHLFSDSTEHVRFNRFFSPGITFPLLLIGLLPLVSDPDLNRRRSLIAFGLVLGLQLYVYPHAIVFLACVGGAIFAIEIVRNYQLGWPLKRIIGNAARRGAWIAGAALLVAIPYLRQSMSFRASADAADIMARIGFGDDFFGSVRTPVLLWLALAVVLKTSANRRTGHGAWDVLSTSRDRAWLALTLGSAIATWIPGLLSEALSFPTPWLIPLRIVSYLVPVLVAYPLVQWLSALHPAWPTKPWAKPLRVRAMAAYCALLIFGEFAAASRNADGYQITDEMSQFQNVVLTGTKPDSIVMTGDLRLAAWLVCETDRTSFIGYGSSSNASNAELLQRIMTVAILQGKSFDDFYNQCYRHGYGLPEGPSGEHWTLHHGSSGLSYGYARLKKLYSKLQKRSPRSLMHRYDCDYVYLPRDQIAAPFSELVVETSDPMLQRIKKSQRKTKVAQRPSTGSKT